jgi:hypothetical protein
MQELADRWTVILRAFPTHWAAVDPLPWVEPAGGGSAVSPPVRSGTPDT